MKKSLFLLSLVIFVSCQAPKEQADLLLVNANIYTVDESFGKAEAMAVKDGKILAVGSTDDIKARYEGTEWVDAAGKTVIPGIIDAHCHFYGLGLNQLKVDLVGTRSFEEVLERVRTFQEQNPSNFIQGRGWDQNDWEVKEFPTKEELDRLFPDTPVALERVDGHAYLVNQKALDLAGITEKTRVSGGEIIKKDGKITGVLVDNPMYMIDAIVPPPTREMDIKALKDAEALCVDYGLTTVNDAGLMRGTIELIDSLQQAGDLSIRVYAMVSNSSENVDHFLEKGIVKTDRLNVRSVKVYGDGALGSRGAALREPYSDQPGHFGAMVTPVEDIEALAMRLASSEYQMNTHAIGDSANIAVLRAYEKALAGKPDRRWKIE
ncbi:amidohydrolase, partial [Muriicola sp.]|uniref:amidohydrolase n=1 Tax=Muriicola sp. TaxID=2020856 RepID=UPI003562287A